MSTSASDCNGAATARQYFQSIGENPDSLSGQLGSTLGAAMVPGAGEEGAAADAGSSIFSKFMNLFRGRPAPAPFEPNATVGDLVGLAHDYVDENGNWMPVAGKQATVARRDDADLVDSTVNPTLYDGPHGQPITISWGDTLTEGNHRAAELLSRAADPFNKNISYDTPIYIRNFGG